MKKLEKFKKLLKNKGLSQVLITIPNDIYYLIGHSPNQLSVSGNSNIATLYISQDRTVLITMDYEHKFIENQVDNGVEVISYKTWTGIGTTEEYKTNREFNSGQSSIDVVKTLLTDEPLGLQLSSISYQYANNFENVVDISNLLFEMKMIKTDREIEEFRNLCKIQTTALKEMTKAIKVGITEKELIDVYRNSVFASNYCVPSAWTMLCSGVNSAYLSTPTNKKIEANDVIKFDGGVNMEYSYFTTDMSRSFVVGKQEELANVKRVLVDAQKLMIDNIKPGIKCSEIFEIGFNYVKNFYPGYVRGHLGHSISFGPSTFEPPFINKTDDTIMQEGMIFCIEVPLYIKDKGGFNIEDMVLVTNNGAEVLTSDIDHYEYENNVEGK